MKFEAYNTIFWATRSQYIVIFTIDLLTLTGFSYTTRHMSNLHTKYEHPIHL